MLRIGSWGLDAGGLGADGWVLGLNQVTHALLQKVHVSTYVGGFRNLYSRLGLCNEAYLLYMPHLINLGCVRYLNECIIFRTNNSHSSSGRGQKNISLCSKLFLSPQFSTGSHPIGTLI